jgi:hypothetical protein
LAGRLVWHCFSVLLAFRFPFLIQYMQLLSTHTALLVLAAGLATGCSDKATPTPEPTPEPTATVTRNIAYHDTAPPARRDTVFQQTALTPTAELRGGTLFINLRTKPNREGFLFALNRGIPASLVGTYSYQSRQNGTPPANLNYYAFVPGSNGLQSWSFGSFVNTPTGAIVITAYDVKRQLLSGTFTADISNASDPFEEDDAPIHRRCTIALSGTFTNLTVQPTQ